MALTKNDLVQIKTVVKTEVSESEKRLTKKIEDEVGDLAAMTKRGFDAQDEHFARQDERFDGIEKHLKKQDENFLEHDFKMAEMVHKSDHFKLEERVARLENPKLKSASA